MEREGASGRNPTAGSVTEEEGEPLFSVPCGDWVQLVKAAWAWLCLGDTSAVGETIVAPEGGEDMDTLINEGGVNLTGERMALGRGRSLDVLTVETNCTGPLTSSSSSSSVLLEESLPESLDSLSLDELELLEEEVELPSLPFPRRIFLALVTGIRGGMLEVAVVVVEMVVICTPPTLETCKEEEERVGFDEEVSIGLCATGRAEEDEETVRVVSVEVEEGGGAMSVEIAVMG